MKFFLSINLLFFLLKIVYFKLAIWWYKANGMIRFEFAQFDTLMKLNVVNGD